MPNSSPLGPEVDREYLCYTGQTNPGIYTYDHWDSHRMVLHATSVPAVMLGALSVRRSNVAAYVVGGEKFGETVNSLFPHRILGGALHGIPQCYGRVRCKESKIVISCPPARELDEYVSTAYRLLQQISRKAGVHLLLTHDEDLFDRSSTLLLGTCAMADSIEDGVVDPEGRVFNCPGLYITDGSTIPASLGVNPYLTIAANAERLSAAIAEDACHSQR